MTSIHPSSQKFPNNRCILPRKPPIAFYCGYIYMSLRIYPQSKWAFCVWLIINIVIDVGPPSAAMFRHMFKFINDVYLYLLQILQIEINIKLIWKSRCNNGIHTVWGCEMNYCKLFFSGKNYFWKFITLRNSFLWLIDVWNNEIIHCIPSQNIMSSADIIAVILTLIFSIA